MSYIITLCTDTRGERNELHGTYDYTLEVVAAYMIEERIHIGTEQVTIYDNAKLNSGYIYVVNRSDAADVYLSMNSKTNKLLIPPQGINLLPLSLGLNGDLAVYMQASAEKTLVSYAILASPTPE